MKRTLLLAFSAVSLYFVDFALVRETAASLIQILDTKSYAFIWLETMDLGNPCPTLGGSCFIPPST